MHKHTIAVAIAILAGIAGMFLSVFLTLLPLFLSEGRAAQEKARAPYGGA
jgi:hypothetical protein